MEITPLMKKFRIQAGQRVLVMNAPDAWLNKLGEFPEGDELSTTPDGIYDFVLYFISSKAEFEAAIKDAISAVRYDGLLWIAYPMQSSGIKTDVNRDILWQLSLQTGLRPVTQIAIDETWSALRFRPAERVGSA